MVLGYLRAGASNKQVCRELNIALPTVKTHVQNILRKANVASRVELIASMRGRVGVLHDSL